MSGTVLIIDDNEKNLKLFKLIIESIGHKVLCTRKSTEGIALANEHLPDLILMDIQMPEIDGIEAFGILKKEERTAKIPVIALTSYAMKGDRERFLKEGFAHYIPKPIEKNSFIEDIKRILKDPDNG